MERVLAIRWLPFALLLSGCGAASDITPVVQGLWTSWRERGEDAAPVGKRTPSRETIEEVGAAMVQVNLEGDAHWPILGAVSQNGAYVTYVSRARQSLTLRESQVTGTRGYGTDLVSATSSANDPLATLTPPGDWPGEVTREYRFAGGPDGRLEVFTCTLTRAGEAQIELAGTPFAVVGFAEQCTGDSGSFTNLHAADAQTGRVWQSRQWIGPDVPMLTVEVLEPVG